MAIHNLLCVDNEEIWRNIVQLHFKEHLTPNFHVANDYASALEKIRETHYDLIILDSLEGDCFRLYHDIKDLPHGDVVIFSGNDTIRAEARKQDIPFYSKSNTKEEFKKIIAQYHPTA